MENYQIESIENEVKIRGNKNKRFNLKYLIEEDNIICKEGDRGEKLYITLKGSANVLVQNHNLNFG